MSRKYTSLPITKEYNVAVGNFDDNRLPITTIVIHTSVGTIEGAAARFNNPSSKVSAHYAIGWNEELYAFLEEYFVAYATGVYAMNQKSISIEHIDNWNGKPPEPLRTDALYETSAKLVADICTYYNLPINRTTILRHKEVPGSSTACPDNLDIDRIVKRALEIANPQVLDYKALYLAEKKKTDAIKAIVNG